MAIAALVITLFFNFPFLQQVVQATTLDSFEAWLFLLSVPVLLTSLLIVFLTLTGVWLLPRLVLGISLFVSSLLFYATSAYGVIFDRSMIQNIVETNSGEALSYLNIGFTLFFIFICLGSVVVVVKKQPPESLIARVKSVGKLNVIAVVAIAAIAGFLYKDYASVGRNNRHLSKYIVPFAFYDASYKFVRDTYLSPPLPFRTLDGEPVLKTNHRATPRTLVVVVGETARADKFSLNGYARDTNAMLATQDVVSFSDVTSCGTATAVSVPCMFSRLNREDYSTRMAESQDNVLDIINRAGADTLWIDNNSSCKGVCERIEHIVYDPSRDPQYCDGDYCLDAVLLELLNTSLSQQDGRPRVLVLHMIGSHGPTYYRRYPPEFKKFEPDCPRSDIQNCSQDQLTNTYDNTIAYTDFILSNIIERLSTVPNSAMLYVSDHGESLGENGIYLHGFPYSLAPTEQTDIPMIYWDSWFDNAAYKQCVMGKRSTSLSHDNMFDLMLGLSGVHSTTYNAKSDVLSDCYTNLL